MARRSIHRASVGCLLLTLGLAWACSPEEKGPAGCWWKHRGMCQQYGEALPPKAKSECADTRGDWVFPTCLTLDAVGHCKSSDGATTIYYSQEKFTEEQATKECSGRSGFTFGKGSGK